MDDVVLKGLRKTFTKVIDTFAEELEKELGRYDPSAFAGSVHIRNTLLVDEERDVYLPVIFKMETLANTISKKEYLALKRLVKESGMEVVVVSGGKEP